jgi:integrase
VVAEIEKAGLPQRGWWCWPRIDGQPGPNQPHRVSQLLNDYLHAHGISETPHQLRHWFGTTTMAASHDLRIVQELLGHASPSTTAGYVAWDTAAAAAAAAALPVPAAGNGVPS